MQAWQLVGLGAASLLAAVAVVATKSWHHRWTGDFENSGVQKHHAGSPPRIGALPVLLAVVVGLLMLGQGDAAHDQDTYKLLLNIVLASLPVVALGLADDLTKRVPPGVRMFGALAAGVAAMLLLNNYVPRVNIPGLDLLVSFGPVAVVLTLLMVAGFSNAMNIVDGLNGLSGGLAMLMLAATGYAAASMGDVVVVNLCAVLAAAIGGFMLVNFPRGLMFLGDGAAYFIGFALAQIWMLLLARHAELSTWFVVAVAAHPTMETVFSMYRRRIHRGRGGSFTTADRLHLHTLVFRRRLRPLMNTMPWMEPWMPNALASMMVVAFGAMPILAACLAPTSSAWCAAVLLAYAVAYVLWFRHLVWFGRMFSPAPQLPVTKLGRSASAA
jgi:UDP-N-acetylmuramyl pentapeptide phosphotransferase/UDP-N-acetylglucosamine-1-phosphate transferase